MKQTPFQYLDYLTSDVVDAKEKALDWMHVSLASNLRYASTQGWLSETVDDADAVVYRWATQQ